MRILVTGGSGKLGTETIRQLMAAGHEVINLDLAPPREALCRFMRVDFTDYGQVVECFTGIDGGWDSADALVHLAAIPGPAQASNARVFTNNTASTFHLFWAARTGGVRNIVWASSETLTGVPFDEPPTYLPIDEASPRRPQSAYSLGKLVDEVLAAEFCRWDASLKMTALRFSYVKSPDEYPAFAELQKDARLQHWNFWSYIDVRDAAAIVPLALERHGFGLEAYLVASPDTVMERSTLSLLAEVYPEVPIKGELGEHQSLLSTAKAQAELGWIPRHSWRTGA